MLQFQTVITATQYLLLFLGYERVSVCVRLLRHNYKEIPRKFSCHTYPFDNQNLYGI